MADETIEQRREDSNARLNELTDRLSSWEERLGAAASVYAIGSYGRQEASRHSDLDVFLVGNGTGDKPGLSRLEQIALKADIIAEARELGFQEFSNDGEYLQYYETLELVGKLGMPDDEHANTLTARLLMLLESRVLVGHSGYAAALESVIGKYWSEFPDHRDDFRPMFLANDILRLWRTFCLNYEARTRRDPPEKNAKRKLKNYKLKHSRLMTCFSAISYLLAVYQAHGTVSVADASAMAAITPVERVAALPAIAGAADVEAEAAKVRGCYAQFLRATDQDEATLLATFGDRERSSSLTATADHLGDAFFELLQKLGAGGSFYRSLVV